PSIASSHVASYYRSRAAARPTHRAGAARLNRRREPQSACATRASEAELPLGCSGDGETSTCKTGGRYDGDARASMDLVEEMRQASVAPHAPGPYRVERSTQQVGTTVATGR